MKKGCFFTFVIIFTLIVGIVIYIKKYKLNDIKNFAREKLSGVVINDLTEKLKKVKPSVYKDSLSHDLDQFFKVKTDLKEDSTMHQYGDVIDATRSILKDLEIDSGEYIHFKNILSRYERATKNRN